MAEGAAAGAEPKIKRKFLLVGLTGGIGSGKSMGSRMFRDLGCLIIDADLLAREVVEPGEPAHAKIVAEFGKQVLDAEGQIDRKKLGALVFGDPAKRKRLEGFTHPEIRQRQAAILAELITEGFEGIVIFDAALLVETGGAKNMDRLVVVYAAEATQLRRLMLRDNIPEAEALQKIRSQMPLSLKVKQAHYVVDNSGTREETERRVQEVHQALLADLQSLRATPS
jgi:dephospho-CoA kinase